MLYAPNEYWEAPKESLSNICNGCGAKNGIDVPDSILGIDITEVCDIHDFMFESGRTVSDFRFSNAIFILNLVTVISKSSRLMLIPRLIIASKYFILVSKLGFKYFMEGKIIDDSKSITYKGKFENARK